VTAQLLSLDMAALRSVDTQFDCRKRHQSSRPRTAAQKGFARECGR
jgi:hypothetical protein